MIERGQNFYPCYLGLQWSYGLQNGTNRLQFGCSIQKWSQRPGKLTLRVSSALPNLAILAVASPWRNFYCTRF